MSIQYGLRYIVPRWREVVGSGGAWQVSDRGAVYAMDEPTLVGGWIVRQGRPVAQHVDEDGDSVVILNGEPRKVRELTIEAFIKEK